VAKARVSAYVSGMTDTRLSPALTDPLPLARKLIQAPSVTPVDAGALDVLGGALEAAGI
jgi:hypothetical protein